MEIASSGKTPDIAAQLTAIVTPMQSAGKVFAELANGRDPVHDSKVAEAEAFQASSVVGAFMQMEIDIKAMAAAEVASGILAKRATEQAAKLANEAVFIATRLQIKAATSHSGIKAAAEAVNWPDLSGF
ncbi:MAG: hypothetical protein COB37_11485 [Kordiimonadales bacterium]|nr:MAG: hypothetical protein COB37_11485 [Kordiimonadales bacterium]